MTFKNINNVDSCVCINDAEVDCESIFIRRIKDLELQEIDFKSHWERGIFRGATKCKEICSLKGVSINICHPELEEAILKKYETTFSFNPKKGAYAIKFKLKPNSGLIKHSPEGGDQTHFNLLKCDDFELSSLDLIAIVKFA